MPEFRRNLEEDFKELGKKLNDHKNELEMIKNIILKITRPCIVIRI